MFLSCGGSCCQTVALCESPVNNLAFTRSPSRSIDWLFCSGSLHLPTHMPITSRQILNHGSWTLCFLVKEMGTAVLIQIPCLVFSYVNGFYPLDAGSLWSHPF